MKRILPILLLPVLSFAAEVSDADAARAAQAWADLGYAMGELPAGRAVAAVEAVEDPATGARLFVAKFEGGGFVVLSADDLVDPVIAFSGTGDGVDSDDGNPLWALLRGDIAAREAAAGVARAPAAGGKKAAPAAAPAAAQTAAQRKWAELLSGGGTRRGAKGGVAALSDVRVDPFLRTSWGQGKAGGKNVWNLYTPGNCVCGCVATAGSQIMKHFEWPKTAVAPKTWTCATNGTDVDMTMFGGTYDWASMPLAPGPSSVPTDAECEAAGKLAYDVGVSVCMDWEIDNGAAGAQVSCLMPALVDDFGYSGAVAVNYNGDRGYPWSLDAFKTAVIPNLDSKRPVALAVQCIASVEGTQTNYAGHAILLDGYGYSGPSFFAHANCGWLGNSDVWYAPPEFDTDAGYDFTTVLTLLCNVFTNETGNILSGRVLDPAGYPVPGAAVALSDGQTTTADDRGVYAFVAAEGADYTVTAASGTASGSVSASLGTTTPVELVNRRGTYEGSTVADQNVGNSYGNDVRISTPSAPVVERDPHLVGLYTFDHADPFEATIGAPAREGVIPSNNNPPALSATPGTISLVTDPDVLGDRRGVVSVPSKSTLAIPNPGLRKNWTIVLPFYCPANAGWRCFFQFNLANNGDGSLFIRNNTDIGASSYTGVGNVVGAWHQLVVSCTNGTATVWCDAKKLDQTRSWTLPGNGLLYFSLDNDGEDSTMYLDDIRLYDATEPAEVFPDGRDEGPAILEPFAEGSFADDFASFTRVPDEIFEAPPHRVYVFNRHGSFSFTPVRKRDGGSVLLVGGGGAGGLLRGGGGGGGAVVHETDVTFLAQTYTATVGAGGVPDIHAKWWSGQDLNQIRPGPSTAATCGGTSALADFGGTVLFSAPGGGGGGNFNYANGNIPAEGYGLDGASGGGAAGKSVQPGLGTDGLGHDGGEAATDGDNSGGGGGGAGGPGTKGSNSVAGAGGAGVTNSITGSPVVYGGGGGASSYNLAGGRGGEGGGGNGVASNADGMRDTACSGVDGLGGGGGGGSGRDNAPKNTMGGRGGDGAVVLRVLMISGDDPEPGIVVTADDVGYTNATVGVRLLTLGSGGSWASLTLRLSANADMSDPFLVTNLGSSVSSVPAGFSVAWSPLLTNATYYAQATAENDLGVTGTSALVAFTTLEPQPPTLSLTPGGVGFGSISADVSLGSFGAGSDWADLYLDCSALGDFSDTVSSAATRVDALPFADTLKTGGLAPGSNYFYRVRAVNAWGVAGFTDVWQAETEADPVRLSSIGATPAADGSQTIAVSTLAVESGTTYALTISVDGATVATFTGLTATDTFTASYSGRPGSSHVAVVAVAAQYGGRTYEQSARVSFSIGGNNVVVSDWSAHCSAASAIRIHVGDTIVLPALAWGWRYRVLHDRFLSMDGAVVTALEPAVAGIEVWNGDTLMDTIAVLVLPDAIEGGDVYVYKEAVDTNDRIWTVAAAWDKIGDATDSQWPCKPNDIAVIPFYDTTGTVYLRHMTDLSVGGILFGNFRDVAAECRLERHKNASVTKTVSFARTDGEPAFVKVTPNTTAERSQTLRFGGYDILLDCVSSVETDSCSNPTNAALNRGFITYSACTVNIPEGNYWAVDGIPGYYINMGGTIGPPQLTGEGTFWKKGMGGITFGAQNGFRGTLLDTGHGHLGGYNRAASIFWNGGGGTNVSISVAGWCPPRLGNPAEDSSSGYGRFRTGWEHFYGAEAAHPDVPWNPRKTMTLRGGAYIAYSTQNGPSWGGPGSKSLRLYEKLVVGPGRSYACIRGNTSNKDGHPTNWVQWDDLEHEDKGTLVLFDWSRRSVAATQDSTNSVAMLPRHAAFLVGAGVDGDCLVSDVYPIIPWIVAPTTTDDSSWRNTMFASFDADGRLTRPVWTNTPLDGVRSPFSNAYLWDKTIEIGRDVTVNSLFMNNSGKNKWLGEGRTLTITSGGLVLHNSNTAIGQPGREDNGSLVLGDADHPGYVFAKSSDATKPNQIWADVTAPGGFVSSYSGALVLGGNQRGIGDELVVNAGILTLGTAELGCSLVKNLGVRVGSGARLVVPREEGLRGTFLRMDAAGGATGTVQLDADSSCKKLYVRDWPVAPEWTTLPRGFYGSSESGAKNVRDDLFSGPGVLRVVTDDCIDPTVLLLR